MNLDIELRDPGDKFNIELTTQTAQTDQTAFIMWISDDD